MARPQKDYSHLSGGAHRFLEQVKAGQVRIPLKRGTRLIESDAEAQVFVDKIKRQPPGHMNYEL